MSECARDERENVAIVLTGGGARAAYQAGLLRAVARHAPDLRFPIITGVSAGAINAVFLASHPGTLGEAAEELANLWAQLDIEQVFRTDLPSLAGHFMAWGARLASGGSRAAPKVRGFVDSSPLGQFLRRTLRTVDGEIAGIAGNLESGKLRATAITALSYSTSQSITWFQGDRLESWDRAHRRGVRARLTVDHVMASAALPFFFPAVRVGGSWYGDGGIRLSAPLSPALHLGASRILALSTRYQRSTSEADLPVIAGYPPPAQILGNLLNAVFLDIIDQDYLRAERINRLVCKLPPEQREGLRPVDILVLRPSEDLGKLSGQFEHKLPRAFRFLTRGLGTRETSSPDFLSLLMFQPDYLRLLLEIGERDGEAQSGALVALLGDLAPAARTGVGEAP